MESNKRLKEDLVKKYILAGRIRFISFCLLFVFLLIMKFIGGFSYLNTAFIALIFIEALLNQPYGFIIKRVNVYRLQYYQMAVDIIAISWILYYMGGIEAPLVGIAYYVVILWAGVVSNIPAVFFATIASVILFSSVVILEYLQIFPAVSYYNYKMPFPQMFSQLCGNVSFLFAFGYFCARSSSLIKSLEKKREEDSLRHTHKLIATGNLVGNTAHDLLNYLAGIKGYAEILLPRIGKDTEEGRLLKNIEKMVEKSADILTKLRRFSRKPSQEFHSLDIHMVIEDAFALTWPLMRYANVAINKEFGADIPNIMMDKDQIQEVFVALIFNSLDAMPEKGTLTIKTSYIKQDNMVKIIFSDTGRGIRERDLDRIAEPFFSTKSLKQGVGLGLTIVYGVIARHKGSIEVESSPGKGTTFTIMLPNKPKD